MFNVFPSHLSWPVDANLASTKLRTSARVGIGWDGLHGPILLIGLSHDLGAGILSTKGTYIFMLPSAYGSNDSNKASCYLDVCGQLFETAMENPTAFTGVPWVLEVLQGFMRTCKQALDVQRRQRIQDAIQALKNFGSGGAATNGKCIERTNQLGIPLVLDIRMTQLGGKDNDLGFIAQS